MAGAGCDSRSSTLLSPTQERCGVTLSTVASTIGAPGGTSSLTVTAARECQWSASSDAGWLSITSGSSGQGTGTVSYSATPNQSTTSRRGTIAVGDQRVDVTQEAATCTAVVSPDSVSIGPNGGEARITISTDDFCSWTAVSQVSWITVASNTNGTGRAEIAVRIAANTGDVRSSVVSVAGVGVTVSQAAGSTCAFEVTPTAFDNVPSAGLPLEVTVTAPPGCIWTASSTESWIQVAEGASGSGTGRVRLTILPSSGAARSGTVTVAGRTVRVDQRTGVQCDFSVSPSHHDAPATGGAIAVQITTSSACAWEVTGTPTWVSADTTRGAGTRPITLTIQDNPGSPRSASFTIATRQFTVNQAARPGCSYTVTPTSHTAPSGGGPTSVTVTTGAGCSWTATSNAAWITITSGASGTGPGSVNLGVAGNLGGARTGTATIAGQAFTVNQEAAPCTYTINPTKFDVSANGGSTTVTVTTASHCSWTVSGAPSWVRVNPTGRTGSGTTMITVDRNPGDDRHATFQIAGQNFRVDQDEDD